MDPKRTKELIDIFQKIRIRVDDLTSDIERSEGRKKVRVQYEFVSSSFQSEELYYQRVTLARNVDEPGALEEHFGTNVYWLDLNNHDWPQGSNESDLETIVIPDICGENAEFGDLLYKLANNAQTGWIQEMTKDGQRGQYYHNLVNNNHWHDLILMIQAFIKTKGGAIDEKYFAPLVFEWQGEKGNKKRVSLSRHFGGRRMIDLLQENIRSAFKIIDTMADTSEVIRLLEHKPQVILQGPPGTGKTRLAKEVALKLCKQADFMGVTADMVRKHLYNGLKLVTPKDNVSFEITDVGSSVQIGISTGAKYSISVDAIVAGMNDQKHLKEESYYPPIIAYLSKRIVSANDQIKLVQFHPSYSYEDFVRGITSKITDGQIEYVAQNKALADFAQTALANYTDHNKDVTALSKEKWAESMMNEYVEHIEESLTKDPKYKIGDSIAYIFEIEDDAFRYKGDQWEQHKAGLRMKFSLLLDAYMKGADNRKDFKRLYESGLVSQHATYFSKVLQDFKKFLATKPKYSGTAVKPALKNYVLIIDEINRANLSSVLGELIYGLEYRGRPVDGIYSVDGDSKIILPPNLYIIGTMNTADRSVGHIDYAIRRRFCFYTVLPNESIVESNGSLKAVDLFKKMRRLFVKDDEKFTTYLSPEFNWEDVMIGHSYFLEKEDAKLQMRLQYEIKPILKEYIKDGILLEAAWAEIEKW